MDAGTSRSRNRRGQGELLRQEIIEAALRMLNELGDDEALSLRAVAREVGIAATSVYIHFADRDELVFTALEKSTTDLLRDLEQAEDNAGEDPVRRLRARLLFLGTWVREKKVLTLEEAVRRMTSDPADFFGIRDRGRIAPGMAADLVLFDPDTVGSAGRPERLYDLPGGAKRMVMRSRGIHMTLVNGEVTWQDGKLTGARAGRVLRS